MKHQLADSWYQVATSIFSCTHSVLDHIATYIDIVIAIQLQSDYPLPINSPSSVICLDGFLFLMRSVVRYVVSSTHNIPFSDLYLIDDPYHAHAHDVILSYCYHHMTCISIIDPVQSCSMTAHSASL